MYQDHLASASSHQVKPTHGFHQVFVMPLIHYLLFEHQTLLTLKGMKVIPSIQHHHQRARVLTLGIPFYQ